MPVILGSDEATLRFARKLFDNDILATPVLFPAVPRQEGRLRLCVTAAQEKTFLDEVIEVFKNLKDV